MKKYLVLVTCFLSDLAIHCKEGSVILLPSDYKVPESKEGYPPKFKLLGEVDNDVPAGVDPAMAEVEQVLAEGGISRAVAETYFSEVGASTPEEKLAAAKDLAQDTKPKEAKQKAKK